jgi:hypothetical protein
MNTSISLYDQRCYYHNTFNFTAHINQTSRGRIPADIIEMMEIEVQEPYIQAKLTARDPLNIVCETFRPSKMKNIYIALVHQMTMLFALV